MGGVASCASLSSRIATTSTSDGTAVRSRNCTRIGIFDSNQCWLLTSAHRSLRRVRSAERACPGPLRNQAFCPRPRPSRAAHLALGSGQRAFAHDAPVRRHLDMPCSWHSISPRRAPAPVHGTKYRTNPAPNLPLSFARRDISGHLPPSRVHACRARGPCSAPCPCVARARAAARLSTQHARHPGHRLYQG